MGENRVIHEQDLERLLIELQYRVGNAENAIAGKEKAVGGRQSSLEEIVVKKNQEIDKLKAENAILLNRVQNFQKTMDWISLHGAVPVENPKGTRPRFFQELDEIVENAAKS